MLVNIWKITNNINYPAIISFNLLYNLFYNIPLYLTFKKYDSNYIGDDDAIFCIDANLNIINLVHSFNFTITKDYILEINNSKYNSNHCLIIDYSSEPIYKLVKIL